MKTARNCLSCGRIFWADAKDCRGERKGWCNGRHNCKLCIEVWRKLTRMSIARLRDFTENDVHLLGPLQDSDDIFTDEFLDWTNDDSRFDEVVAAAKAGLPGPKFTGQKFKKGMNPYVKSKV